MIAMSKSLVPSIFLVFFIASSGLSPAVGSEDYRTPPIVLETKDVVPNALLKGKNYTIKEGAVSDGIINTYVLETDYGPVLVEGTGELLIRIDELNALVAMEEMDRKGVFGKSLVKGVKAPFQLVGDLVTSPVDTTKNIGKGTGQFFSNVGRSIVSDDPNQDNVLKVAIGYDTAKRQYAYEFGIDPYTDYKPVRDRLGEIARASVAGGITPRVAMAAADTTITTAMRISGAAKGMKELVRDNPPGALEKINRKKLEQMGIENSLIEAFLDNYAYSPQEKTILIGELETMEGVKGRDMFLAKADIASDESTALYYRLTAQMMAAYHATVKPAERIQVIHGTPFVCTKDGGLILLASVDRVFWTPGIASKLSNYETAIKTMPDISEKELWIAGSIDDTAGKNFNAQGWKITEKANDVFFK